MNIMLDLETLSSCADAAIVAIGATTFSTTGGPVAPLSFYATIDPHDAQLAGGHVDARTVQWWMTQDEAARAVFTAHTHVTLKDALSGFAVFCAQFTDPHAIIWGNGAGFDNVVLRRAYQRIGMEPPWGWSEDRCFRTLKNLLWGVPVERIGTHHNALDDAITQARQAERIFAAMREGAKA